MTDVERRQWPAVPGYELVRVLGRGGYATVYEAVQQSVRRSVALKVMAAATFDAEVEHRFRSECRTVGSLSWHPHVVALYDAGVTPAGFPFLAMEMVQGGSWSDWVKREGPCPPGMVVRIGCEVADALAAAHEAGIIHRDVKPDNVLVGRRGEALLSDFGVASLADSTRSTTGEFKGTFVYSAPELLRSERPTPASDVYAVGATLYTLVSGRSAFAGDPEHDSPAAVVYRVVSEPPPPLPPSVPQPVVDVILRAMAKDPADRHPTARALDHDLRQAQEAVAAAVPSAPSFGGPGVRAPDDAASGQVGAFDRSAAPEVGSEETQPGLTPSPVAGDGSRWNGPVRRWMAAAGVVAVLGLASALVWSQVADDGPSGNGGGRSPTDPSDRAELDVSMVDLGPPGGVGGVTLGFGSVWTIGRGSDGDFAIFRIDRETLERTIIDVDDPRALAVSSDAVWVAAGNQGLLRVDPETNELTTASQTGSPYLDVKAGFGSVWAYVGSLAGEVLRRIDPDSNEIVADIPLEGSYSGFTIDTDAVWLSTYATINRIDPETNAVSEVYRATAGAESPSPGETPAAAADLPFEVVGGGSGVGFVNYEASKLWLIDPDSDEAVTVDISNCDGTISETDFTATPYWVTTSVDESDPPMARLCRLNVGTRELSEPATEISGDNSELAHGSASVLTAVVTDDGLLIKRIDEASSKVTGTVNLGPIARTTGMEVAADTMWIAVEESQRVVMYRLE